MKKTVLAALAFLLVLFATLGYGDSDARAVSKPPFPIQVVIDGKLVEMSDRPVIQSDRVLVPMRVLFNELDAAVVWKDSDRSITATMGSRKVLLYLDQQEAKVDGKTVPLDVPPTLINGRTYVPLRFVGQALGAGVTWENEWRIVVLTKDGKPHRVSKEQLRRWYDAEKVRYEEMLAKPSYSLEKVTIGNKSFNVHRIEMPKGTNVGIGLANGVVGKAAPLQTIASDGKAKAAINGTYFEAYNGDPEPWGTLINKGQLLHRGSVGTVIGFTKDGDVRMDTHQVKITGTINGSHSWPNNWYAYNFNRAPGANASIIFTPERGTKTGVSTGTSVVVKNGKVTQVTRNTNASIPENGFVIVLTGSEEKQLASRFSVGDQVAYQLEHTNLAGQTIPWDDVVTAVGAGPRLVKNGKAAVDPAGEGFASDKILTQSAARSGIGIKADGTIVLAAVPAATIQEWAQIMLKLGAHQAMNLDGGASSGLYFEGATKVKPGRNISNALLFDW